jgi:DNA processing protein
VLGGGLNALYPKSHVKLAQRIVEQGGALVSEQWPDTPAKPAFFPLRNRIVSGLSEGVLVVEASQKSGSLITARMANDAGRMVFSVPCSPLQQRGLGNLDLLSQGAYLVRDAQDIYEPLEAELLNRLGLSKHLFNECDPLIQDPQTRAEGFSEVEKRVLNGLGGSAIHPSELAEQLKMDVGELTCLLMDLDEKGQVVWTRGGRIQLIGE